MDEFLKFLFVMPILLIMWAGALYFIRHLWNLVNGK